MNFALIGDDRETLPVALAILANPRHRLLCTLFAGECQAELMRIDPRIRMLERWEDLLADPALEAVIAAGDNERVLQSVLQAASHGKSVLLFPHTGQGAAFVYELALARDDRPITLVPAFARRVHPLLERIRDMLRKDDLGPLLHLQMEHALHQDVSENRPVLLPTAEISAAFLADVDLLRDLGGEFDQITALHSGGTEDGVATATITLDGEQAIQSSWTCKPTVDASQWRLTLTGQRRTAALSGSIDSATATLDITTPSGKVVSETLTADFGPAILGRFLGAAAGVPVAPSWRDVSRAFEFLDGAKRSLKRRRTIDLHFETPSERSNFKTQMTAIGCGVLSATFFGVLLFLALGAAAKELGLPPGAMQVARVVVFAPLMIFLALQLLVFLAKPAAQREVSVKSTSTT